MLYVGCVLVVEDEDEYSNIRRTTISPVDMAASGKNLSVLLHILVQVYYNFTVHLELKHSCCMMQMADIMCHCC
mgnify:FL=1